MSCWSACSVLGASLSGGECDRKGRAVFCHTTQLDGPAAARTMSGSVRVMTRPRPSQPVSQPGGSTEGGALPSEPPRLASPPSRRLAAAASSGSPPANLSKQGKNGKPVPAGPTMKAGQKAQVLLLVSLGEKRCVQLSA